MTATTERGHGLAWTPDEDLVVRHHYPRLPLVDLAAALGRSEEAIRRRANLLGVTRGTRAPLVRTARAKRPWTIDDDELLRTNWGRRTPEWFARTLGRSKAAIHVRVKRLGVTARDNVWSVSDVARLFGVDAHLVKRWVDEGLLQARVSAIAFGMYGMWNVDYASVERFVTRHPEAYPVERLGEGYLRGLAERVRRADPLLLVDDVCRMHGVSQQCVNTAILRGRLRAVRGFGFNRPYYIRRSDALGFRPLRPELVGHRGRGWREREAANG